MFLKVKKNLLVKGFCYDGCEIEIYSQRLNDCILRIFGLQTLDTVIVLNVYYGNSPSLL